MEVLFCKQGQSRLLNRADKHFDFLSIILNLYRCIILQTRSKQTLTYVGAEKYFDFLSIRVSKTVFNLLELCVPLRFQPEHPVSITERFRAIFLTWYLSRLVYDSLYSEIEWLRKGRPTNRLGVGGLFTLLLLDSISPCSVVAWHIWRENGLCKVWMLKS